MNDLDALLDAVSGAVGIGIEPAWRADVAANLSVLLRFGQDVVGFELPDEAEPASIFAPVA